jgi:negative regulator of flagellin synthesis FlgM
MRIDSGLPVQSQLEIDRTQKKPASATTDKGAPGVTSELSQDVVRLSSLVDQVNATPDIREDKVKALRDSISAGTYEVSPESLAEAILRDAVNR